VIKDIRDEILSKYKQHSDEDPRVQHEKHVTFIKDVVSLIYAGGRTLTDESALFHKKEYGDKPSETFHYMKARRHFLDELWKKFDHMGMVAATGEDIDSLVSHINGEDEKPKRKKKKRAKKPKEEKEETPEKEEEKVEEKVRIPSPVRKPPSPPPVEEQKQPLPEEVKSEASSTPQHTPSPDTAPKRRKKKKNKAKPKPVEESSPKASQNSNKVEESFVESIEVIEAPKGKRLEPGRKRKQEERKVEGTRGSSERTFKLPESTRCRSIMSGEPSPAPAKKKPAKQEVVEDWQTEIVR
jgi:hypothetical protein